MSISAIGARNDMDIQIPGLGANRMTTLTRFKNPNILYRINDQAKTYSEIDTGKATETVARQGAEDSYTVKKLGKETIQGYSCERILITSSRGTAETEMWMTKDLFFENSYRMLEGLGRGAPKSGIMKAMKDQNLEGFVVKMVTREKPGAPAAMTMELVKAERKSLPASLFEIPAGYIKDDSGMGMLPKDAQDRMKEMLKNLPPEQREMLEKKMREGNAK